MAQPPQNQGVSRQAQVSLGLATAGGKEQQVDGAAVYIRGLCHPHEVHQQKGKLKRPPLGLHLVGVFASHHPESLTGCGRHHAVGDGKGCSDLLVFQGFNATFDPLGLVAGLLQELPGRGLLLLAWRVGRFTLLLDPVSVGRHERA